MHILTNAKESGRYDSANNKFLLGGAASGSNTIKNAILQSSEKTDADGLPCEVTIRYLDQAFSTRFETIACTYNDSDNSVTRTETISSSTGLGQINFDAVIGEDNLVIYGTTSHKVFQAGILDMRTYPAGGTYNLTIGQTVNQFYDSSPIIEITPINSLAKISICTSAYTEMKRESELSYGHTINLSYRNPALSWIVVKKVFHKLAFSVTASVNRFEGALRPIRLDQTHLNGAGNWEIKLTQSKSYAGNSGTVSGASFDVIQYNALD